MYWFGCKKLGRIKTFFFSKLTHDGEKIIGKYFVNRFDSDMNMIYQLHGCTSCFDPSLFNKVLEIHFVTLYDRMFRIMVELKQMGCDITEMWECDYLSVNPISKNYLKMVNNLFFATR